MTYRLDGDNSGVADLVDRLEGLSTLLLLTAEAVDGIVSALTGQAVNTAADMYQDSQPDTSADNTRPKLALVRTLPQRPDNPSHDGPHGAGTPNGRNLVTS